MGRESTTNVDPTTDGLASRNKAKDRSLQLASQHPENHSQGYIGDLDEDSFAVLAFRNFIFDICNQNGGGHGGSAIGMAAIGVALYKYIMRYNPSNPGWFDRDRLVLSNGKS